MSAIHSHLQPSDMSPTSTLQLEPTPPTDKITITETENQTSGTSDYSETQVLSLISPVKSWRRA